MAQIERLKRCNPQPRDIHTASQKNAPSKTVHKKDSFLNNLLEISLTFMILHLFLTSSYIYGNITFVTVKSDCINKKPNVQVQVNFAH